jgi:putative dimethyl sulfoxide reductase chaperone
LPEDLSPRTINELAADYAAIYLNNSLGAWPCESVWLDDDHLACQQPMFELRKIYAAAGFKVADWRNRFDDHLVLQLH